MPTSMCPLCGSIMHISVKSVEQFFNDCPFMEFGDYYPAHCLECHGDPKSSGIKVGDRIIARDYSCEGNKTKPGQTGTVERIYQRPDESMPLYVVRLDSGDQQTFPRIAFTLEKYAFLLRHNANEQIPPYLRSKYGSQNE